ncbi:MAG: DUF1998 domain-containing protein [Candidatus Zixiibacteriota bacterium]
MSASLTAGTAAMPDVSFWTFPHIKSPFSDLPTIYIYDNFPGGVGFSEKLFHLTLELWKACGEMNQNCGCDGGCPSCVGSKMEVGERGKDGALKLIKSMTDDGFVVSLSNHDK